MTTSNAASDEISSKWQDVRFSELRDIAEILRIPTVWCVSARETSVIPLPHCSGVSLASTHVSDLQHVCFCNWVLRIQLIEAEWRIYAPVNWQSLIQIMHGLSYGRRQAIILTNAGIMLIGPLGTNFSEISIQILTFSFEKMLSKLSSAKWRPFCLGLNVLTYWNTRTELSHRCACRCLRT